MKKKILLLIIILLAELFVGIPNISAYSFNSFKKGDKIEVRLNKNLKLNFYVIEDSTSEDYSITAIYEDVLGDMFWYGPTTNSLKGSTAEAKLQELTKKWITPYKIRLIEASEIKNDLKISEKETFDIESKNYFHIGKSYWTQTVVKEGGQYYPYLVTSWNTYSNLHSTQDESPASGGYIRPVVEVDKNFIKNAVISKHSNWEEFISDLKEFLNICEENAVISYTNDSLIIKYEDETLTYKRNEGVISGVMSDIHIDALYYLFSINKDLLFEMLDDQGGFQEVHNDNADITLNEDNSISFKVNFAYYLGFDDKKNNQPSPVIENPKTVDYNAHIILAFILMLVFVAVISIKRLNKTNN